MYQYVANRNVFRDCLKLFPPIIGFRKLSGPAGNSRPTYTSRSESPLTIEAESVARYDYRSCRVADQRCCRDATPTTGWHNSTRYGGDWPCRQLNTMMPSLYTTSSGTSSQCSSVLRSRDKPQSNLWDTKNYIKCVRWHKVPGFTHKCVVFKKCENHTTIPV